MEDYSKGNLSLKHSGYRCSLSCIHIRFLSRIHPSVNALNRMPALTWLPLWDEQASALNRDAAPFSEKCKSGSYLMLLHHQPPRPRNIPPLQCWWLNRMQSRGQAGLFICRPGAPKTAQRQMHVRDSRSHRRQMPLIAGLFA